MKILKEKRVRKIDNEQKEENVETEHRRWTVPDVSTEIEGSVRQEGWDGPWGVD